MCSVIPCATALGEEGGIWRPDQDHPPPYTGTSFKEFAIFRPEVMKTIEAAIYTLNGDLRELSIRIHGMRT